MLVARASVSIVAASTRMKMSVQQNIVVAINVNRMDTTRNFTTCGTGNCDSGSDYSLAVRNGEEKIPTINIQLAFIVNYISIYIYIYS